MANKNKSRFQELATPTNVKARVKEKRQKEEFLLVAGETAKVFV